MNATVAIVTVLIVVARIVDMTMDTLRTAAIVQGRRVFAACLGFIQAMVYICAIAKVLQDLGHPTYALAYGLGFALGTYLGIAIEQRLAFGNQLTSLFTHKGIEMGQALLAAGYRVAKVEGHIREGEVAILYVGVPRRQTRRLIQDAVAIDPNCFCVVNDVRAAGYVHHSRSRGNHRWRRKKGYLSPEMPA